MSLLTLVRKSRGMTSISNVRYPARRTCAGVAGLMLALVYVNPVSAMSTNAAQPYIPEPDEVVLVRDYPVFQAHIASNGKTNDEQEEQRLRFIRTLISHGLQKADSQSLGYAQGLLNSWSETSGIPIEVRLFRAMIAQQQHQFEYALEELAHILKLQPTHSQARFIRASIYLARGNYAEAEKDCRAVALFADPVMTANCLAQVLGPRGQAGQMLQKLTTLLELNPDMQPEVRRELLTTMADLHLISGDPDLAQSAYEDALAISPDHPYLVAQYSELLLQQQAYGQIGSFFAGSDSDSAAHNRSPEKISTSTGSFKNTLATRVYQAALEKMDASQDVMSDSGPGIYDELTRLDRRDDADTEKWWALYYLYIDSEPTKALAYAKLNWENQKSLPDARLLKQAAENAVTIEHLHARETLSVLSDWLNTRGIVDQTL